MLIGDGMADEPLSELGNKTPLEFARTPHMDYIAKQGRGGMATTVPKNMNPASDVAILSLLGYQPTKYYTGRGPLEAASLGIKLKKDEVAFRCNLITVEGDTLVDYSAGHISNREAETLIKFLNEKLGNEDIEFYSGTSYRHLMISNLKPSVFDSIKCVPPHDIIGQSFKKNFPQGEGGEILQKLMKDSFSQLDKHEINSVRRDLGENPGNMIWLWGQGAASSMPTFRERFRVEGSVISEVDVVKGIACYAGLEVINVPGATGYFDTDYEGMARAALKSLEKKDFTCVHVEAPEEAGHMGDLRAKLQSIEDFDRKVVGIVLEGLKNFPEYRVIILPDHPTPLKLRTHTRDPVPFAFWGTDVKGDEMTSFSESAARKGSLHLKEGWRIMEHFLNVLADE